MKHRNAEWIEPQKPAGRMLHKQEYVNNIKMAKSRVYPRATAVLCRGDEAGLQQSNPQPP